MGADSSSMQTPGQDEVPGSKQKKVVEENENSQGGDSEGFEEDDASGNMPSKKAKVKAKAEGFANMEDVALRLGLHPRTLRRRLRQEGTSFETIKDEVRHAAARELLMLGALGIADIAFTLDYASVSSFVHAFRRWSGVSPGRWRAERGG